jgi:hypothetical protein
MASTLHQQQGPAPAVASTSFFHQQIPTHSTLAVVSKGVDAGPEPSLNGMHAAAVKAVTPCPSCRHLQTAFFTLHIAFVHS